MHLIRQIINSRSRYLHLLLYRRVNTQSGMVSPEQAPVPELAPVSDDATSVEAEAGSTCTASASTDVTLEPSVDTDLTGFEQKCVADYAVNAYLCNASKFV